MADTRGKNVNQINGKRQASTIKALRQRRLKSPDGYKGARALVRVGVATTDILIGKDDLSDWSEEELRRGRRRDKNGGWMGKDPVVVARAVHDELVKRTLEDANRILTENLQAGLEILVDIMKDERVEAKDRLRAIEMITNRAMGKEPQKLEVTSESKWQIALADSIVSMPEALGEASSEERDEEIDDDDEVFDGSED